MRAPTVLLGLPLVLAVAFGSSAIPSADASAPNNTPHGTKTTATTVPPTTLATQTVPPTSASGSDNPAATGNILFIKLYVGNVAAAEKFYGAVFGAKLAIKLGNNAHIVTLPKGPGLALLKNGVGPNSKNRKAGFIIQVPSLTASRALAVANGAKVQAKFAGSPGGQAAQSIDLLDPWGNQVEILQIG